MVIITTYSRRMMQKVSVLTFYFFNNECMQEKRFHNWLEGARDWAVSRTRFWGTPLPLWMSQDGEEIVVMDSIEKLEKLSGVKVSIFLSGFISSLPQLAWEKRLCCCCCC